MTSFAKKCPNCGTSVDVYRHPLPTADVVVFHEGSVLLIERKNPPLGWALPGGFVDYGEAVEEAARRELAEETGLRATFLRLLGVYSAPGRDPRFHTLTVAFVAETNGEPAAGDDAGQVKWWRLEALPENIAFDHRQIIQDAAGRERLA